MSAVVVTQADRLAALQQRFGAEAPLDPLYVQWAEVGSAPLGEANPFSAFADVVLRLDGLAQAHAAGRAVERADVVAMIDAAQTRLAARGTGTSLLLSGCLIDTCERIERGEHEGAAVREEDGGHG